MDHYEPVQLLGRGSYGQAVLVTEKSTGVRRVIKEIDFSRLPAAAQREAQKEVGVLKSLNHPHIVAYVDMFEDRRKLCIVMEFADGGDLAGNIKARKNERVHFEESEALRIFGQCCCALQFVHARKILHRDLKCGNIFLTKGGDVKLGDFGIAKVLDHTSAEANTMIGTPIYLAPEICNSEPYGKKADIWSMGVVLYEMLALEAPFQGVNLAALVMKIIHSEPKPIPEHYTDDTKGLVSRLLEKEPDKRPTIDRILSIPALRDSARIQAVVLDTNSAPSESSSQALQDAATRAPGRQRPAAKNLEVDSLDHFVDGAPPSHRSAHRGSSPPRGSTAGAGEALGYDAASEYHRNREIAAQARARAQGDWGLAARGHDRHGSQGRGHSRGRSADSSAPHRSPSGSRRRDSRRHSEEQHRQALHEAHLQARKDREQIKQRMLERDGGGEPSRHGGDPDGEPPPPGQLARHRSAAERAADRKQRQEAQHLAALQEAAAQTRRDRKQVQHRMLELERAGSAEGCTPRSGASHCDVALPGGRKGPSPRSTKAQKEEEHLQALQEAAAQARRDRERIRSRMQDPGQRSANDEADCGGLEADATNPARSSQLQRSSDLRSPVTRDEDPSSSAAAEDRRRRAALQEAAIQARDERRLLQQKRERLESDGQASEAFFCDFGQGPASPLRQAESKSRSRGHRLSSELQLPAQDAADLPPEPVSSGRRRTSNLEHRHDILDAGVDHEGLSSSLGLSRRSRNPFQEPHVAESAPELGSSGRRRGGSSNLEHAHDILDAGAGDREALSSSLGLSKRSCRALEVPPVEDPSGSLSQSLSGSLRPQSSETDLGRSRVRTSSGGGARSPSLGACSSRLAFAGGLMAGSTGGRARSMSAEPCKSGPLSLGDTSSKSLQAALREAREDMEQEDRRWEKPMSLMQSFRGGLPASVTASALAAAESPQSASSAPLPPRPPGRNMPPRLPESAPSRPDPSLEVTPPPEEVNGASSWGKAPNNSFLTAGLLSKMPGFEAPITDENPTSGSLSYSLTRSLGSSY